ncbi:MAG: xanthine dehydrogenase family protein molybdopterin-binding subunit [Proteobacteria bacterium]|nr:xanthine dehydrogenase family protein molybdopterin-binding subunit [Pseudomonadota bacterium]
MSTNSYTTRRDFLKGSAAATGALVIGFTLPMTSRFAQAAAAATPGAGFAPNAFLRIAASGQVTVICGLSEMGQGVHMGIASLVAEELDADWKSVQLEQAPVDKAYNNPLFGMQATGGSTAIRGHYEPMRKAGAAAREMLVAAAATQWGVGADRCRTQDGRVMGPDGKSAGYGELVAAASKLPVPQNPTLKDPGDFRILGKGLTRIDTPSKVNGSAGFGIDVKVPGLLTAVMVHAPVPGAKIVSVDDAAAKAIPGVKQVVQIPQGVAVLADGYWTALKGRDALVVKWDDGPLGSLSSEGISKLLIDATTKPGAVARNEGDVSVAVAKTIEAVYEAPYLAHACMEPMNCTAWVRAGEAEVWAPTQGPGPHQGIVAQLTGLPPEKVQVHTTYLGGGFGRRFAPDFIIASTLISKAAGAPVKLVYTREDDMRGWYYRPASVTRFTAGLDKDGNPVSLTARVASPALSIAAGFATELPKGIDEAAVEGIGDMLYAFPNLRVEYARVEPGIPPWFWRSVGHSQNVYFIEAFIDEVAAAAGKDPVEFRRSLLSKQPRLRGVLDLAAQKVGWGSPLPQGVHRGVAITTCFGSFVAQVAEVAMGANGKPRVQRIVAAVDCGRTVNPDVIHRQVEGAIAYGLSAAMYEKITFKNGRVEQSNFNDYPMLRIDEMPKVEVHIVPSTEAPGGIGEPGLPAATPAVINAIFAATGKRVRTLPI